MGVKTRNFGGLQRAMVVVRVSQVEDACEDAEDDDTGESWAQTVENQIGRDEDITPAEAEPGDMILYWYRADVNQPWPGTAVFALFDEHDGAKQVLFFLEDGNPATDVFQRGRLTQAACEEAFAADRLVAPTMLLGFKLPSAEEGAGLGLGEEETSDGHDESDEDDGRTPLEVGMRVKVLFKGSDGKKVWFGGLVGEVPEANAKGSYLFGFDDGEIKEWSPAKVASLRDIDECVVDPGFFDYALGGTVFDEACPAASGFTSIPGSSKGETIKVGVLLGRRAEKLYGADMYAGHVVDSSRFPSNGTSTRKARSDALSQQDRLGLHTFMAGDCATYNDLNEGEEAVNGVIAALTFSASAEGQQCRKALCIREDAQLIDLTAESSFVAQSWCSWTRLPDTSSKEEDPDSRDFVALTADTDVLSELVKDFNADKHLRAVTKSKALKQTADLPPSLKFGRAKAKKELANSRKKKKPGKSKAGKANGKGGGRGGGKGGGKVGGKGGGKSGGKDPKDDPSDAASDDGSARDGSDSDGSAAEELTEAIARQNAAEKRIKKIEKVREAAASAVAAEQRLASLMRGPAKESAGGGSSSLILHSPPSMHKLPVSNSETPTPERRLKRLVHRLEGEQQVGFSRNEAPERLSARAGDLEVAKWDLARLQKKKRS